MIRALRCMSPKTPLGRLRVGGALCIFRSCRMAVKRRICGRLSIFCDRIFTVSLEIRRKNRRCFRVGFAVLCCGFRLLFCFGGCAALLKSIYSRTGFGTIWMYFRSKTLVISASRSMPFCSAYVRIALTFSASNAHANTPFTFCSIKTPQNLQNFRAAHASGTRLLVRKKQNRPIRATQKTAKGRAGFPDNGFQNASDCRWNRPWFPRIRSSLRRKHAVRRPPRAAFDAHKVSPSRFHDRFLQSFRMSHATWIGSLYRPPQRRSASSQGLQYRLHHARFHTCAYTDSSGHRRYL